MAAINLCNAVRRVLAKRGKKKHALLYGFTSYVNMHSPWLAVRSQTLYSDDCMVLTVKGWGYYRELPLPHTNDLMNVCVVVCLPWDLWVVGLSPGWVRPKTAKMALTASLLALIIGVRSPSESWSRLVCCPLLPQGMVAQMQRHICILLDVTITVTLTCVQSWVMQKHQWPPQGLTADPRTAAQLCCLCSDCCCCVGLLWCRSSVFVWMWQKLLGRNCAGLPDL